MRSLYITHTGMTEPLGQAQVLPYLFGLAGRGVEIELLSFEPAGTPREELEATAESMRSAGVRWSPRVRSARHDLPTKLLESSSASVAALRAALARRPDIVHARSYLPAAVADLVASVTPRAKLLFDCRGMLGDEYVDGGHWTRDRLEFKLLKRVEHRLFRRSEGVVVLTAALRDWLEAQAALGPSTEVQVIPCCVDLDRFRADERARAAARADLNLGPSTLAVVYSGTLGSWYLEPEMARFFAAVKASHADARFVVLSRSSTASLQRAFASCGLSSDDIVVRSVRPAEMAATLPLGDIGLSFIQPCFSKLGSSPTKVAEYLAAGMPAVVNVGVGDQASLAVEADACVVLPSFEPASVTAAAARAVTLATRDFAQRSASARAAADKHFSLTRVGVPRYEALYRALTSRGAR